jgi:transcriptional regulator with XRE-family HTH domain
VDYFYYICKQKRNMANKDLNKLKVVLADKKRTNKWLAEQLGKDQTTISKWCTNTSQPDLASLMKISELLEVDLTELVRFDNKV